MGFKGKVAMITGASVGIGRATALCFAERGAHLVLLDLNGEGLEKVRAETAAYGADVQIYACDVSDEAQVIRSVAEALAHFGRIDILVNNAGVWRGAKLFGEFTSAEWQRFLNINVMGTVHCTNAALPGMVARGWGRIINVGSVAGVYGNRKMVPYSASKGAVIAMTKALAKEVADKGVTVNCVSPGTVNSSADDDPYAAEVYEDESKAPCYMKRRGSDMENADLICYLASEGAAYLSGQNIQIDGCRRKI
ncbi:MAG: SDR family oxidoreductase [Clostridia bacterium]|nr:SDR family oxidoreductase [Clostridia bacterium]